MSIIRVSTQAKLAEFQTSEVSAYEAGTKYLVIYAKVLLRRHLRG